MVIILMTLGRTASLGFGHFAIFHGSDIIGQEQILKNNRRHLLFYR